MHRFEIERPTAEDDDAETVQHRPVSSAFDDLMVLVRLVADPPALQSRLDQLMAAGIKADEARAALVNQQAAHDARVAELDAREAEIGKRHVAVTAAEAATLNRQNQLLKIYNDIQQSGDQLKRQILQYAGMLPNADERLFNLPDWDSLARTVFGQPAADPHYSSEPANDRDIPGDPESVPDAPAAATLTRTGRRPARGHHDATRTQ